MFNYRSFFLLLSGKNGKGLVEYSRESPDVWKSPLNETVYDSKFFVEPQGVGLGNAVGIQAGHDQQGLWSSQLNEHKKGSPLLSTFARYSA